MSSRSLASTANKGGYFQWQRSWGGALVCLCLISAMGCSGETGASPSESPNREPPADVHDGTGGAAITGGSGGLTSPIGGSGGFPSGEASGGAPEGGASGGALTQAGGSGGALVEAPTDLEPWVTIEEDSVGFCSVDGVIEATNAGFVGNGYANTDNALGARIRWMIQVGDAGTYAFEISYANGSTADRSGELTATGSTASEVVLLSPTGDWTTWAATTVNLVLEAGVHEIVLQATTGEGLANVDHLTVVGAQVGASECAPLSGTGGTTGTGGADSGTGGDDSGTGGAGELPNINVYVAGDSTVSTYTDTASPGDQAGWGQMLHEIFDERVTVTNRAIGGRTALWFHLEGGTQWILDRIMPGDYWFVQFGTNDSHPTATFVVDGVEYQRFAAAQTAFKDHLYDHYIVPAREKNATLVLVTPPPRNSAYCGNGNSLGGYAQAMRELAAAEDVILLDLNQRTFDHLAAICPSPTPENFFFLRADNTVDGTHFQENGARHMAGFLGVEMLTQSAGPYLYLLP